MEYKNYYMSKDYGAFVVIVWVGLTGVGAGIGAYASKDKTFGAIMGGLAGFSLIAFPLLMKKINKGKKRNVKRRVIKK